MAKDTQVCGNCVEMNKMRKLILTRTFGFTEQSLEGDKKWKTLTCASENDLNDLKPPQTKLYQSNDLHMLVMQCVRL